MASHAINTEKPLRRVAVHLRLLATTALPWLMLMDASDIALAQTALPQGGSVVSGQATITTPSGNGLTVVQNSSRAIINWNSFSVGQNGSVNFIQPSASSAVLNRVTGSTSSTIAGEISGNGQVLLVNPNGIAITPSGSVEVGGGFIASTLDIANAGFNAGQLNFAGQGASAHVSNAGTISSAPGGFVGLIGGSVSNAGTINVPLGKVGLGSGERATLDPTGDGFLQVAVPTGTVAANGRALIEIAGSIRAAGGTIEIKAATAQQAVRDAVNISGSLAARSVSGRSGNIVLDGGSGGHVTVSGRLAATGGKRHAGGTIVVTGNTVRLRSSARLNASGTTGGTILVGGDLHGGLDLSTKLVPAAVANAQTTVVDQGALINVNGTNGSGGHAVVWSDVSTDFRGTITATGTATGTGGAVEVSSNGVLGYDGSVDVTAASGKTGTLLLDPDDVTISNGPDSNMSGTGNPFSPTGTSSVLSVTTLQNALATANVTVNTGSSGTDNGDITVTNAVTWASGNSLTLSSARDIDVNANIITNGGGLTLSAGRSVNVTSATINTSGGNLNTTASTTDTTTGITLNNAVISVGSGTATLTSTSANGFGVLISGTTSLSASTGSITVTGNSPAPSGAIVPFGAGVGLAASTALTTAGTVTLNGTGGATGNGHGISLQAGATVTSSGSLTLQGTTLSSVTNRFGVYFVSGNSITATSGNVSVIGTGSTSGMGIEQSSGTLVLTNGGGGTFSLSGTGASSAGFDVASGAAITTSGAISLSGQSTSSDGIHFEGGNTLTNSAGNLSLAGSSTSGSGVRLSNANSFANNGVGSLLLTGSSASGNNGLTFDVGAGLATSGNMTLSGTSLSNGDGSYFLGANTVTDTAGNLTINGTSASDSGIFFNSGANALTNSGAGSFTLNGTSSSWWGIGLNTNVGLTSSGNLALSGTSTSNEAIFLNGANSLADSAGNLTIAGTSTSNLGLHFFSGANSLTNSGAGTFSISGTSASAAGVELETGANLTTSGTMTLSGTSGSFIGTYFVGGNNLTVSSGHLMVNGTSTSNSGILLRGTESLTNAGGTLSFNGSTGSYRGIDFFNSADLTFTGGLSFSGTATSGYGVRFEENTIAVSSGDVTINGTSSSSSGVRFGTPSSTSIANNGSGSVTIAGTSSTSSGLSTQSNDAVFTTGAISLSGTSNSGSGVQFGTGSSLTASSGNLTLSGSSSSALGFQLLGTNSITNSGSGQLTLNAVGGADLGGAISSLGGALVLSGSGNINQSGGGITAANLLLFGAAGNFILNASGNQIGTVAASAASLAVTDSSALGIGSVQGTTGVTTSGGLSLVTSGNLTIASGATVSGTSPVLAAAGAFINNAGSGALTATAGRWLVYSNAPGTDSFGGANSHNTAIWNTTYAGLAPGSVAATGNRYVFAYQPVLTVTSTDASKTFGTDVTASLAGHYTISGVQSGVEGAYLGDTAAAVYSGAPILTSPGAAANAGVATTPYVINVGLGSLTSSANYAFAFQNTGRLTVSPLRGSLFDNSSPSSQGLLVNAPPIQDHSDVLDGLGNSSGAINTGTGTDIPSRADTPSRAARLIDPAPAVSSPVAIPAAPSGIVPNNTPAPDHSVAPVGPPVGPSPSAAAATSVVAESACAGNGATDSADHSSGPQHQGCLVAASKSSTGLIDFALNTLNRKALFSALDRELAELRNAESATPALLIKVVAVTSLALTIGFIGWLLRSGALLSALLSILPLWREFDPLMVVRNPRRRDAAEPPPTKVDRMFEDAQGLRYDALPYDRQGPAA